MAKVTAACLQWLSKPSTGYDLFTKPYSLTPPPDNDAGVSPKRLIATRGSDIFVGRGNEVRCADLQDLKARHPDIAVVAEGAKKVGHREYKALNLPQLEFEIRQLEISPDDLFLAVAGETQIAVCVLPGAGFLKREAARPVVPHFRRIGQGHHNPDTGAKILRVLWHPLGVEGASLVVLTADGYVRTYDFTIGNEVSYEVPDQTLDLYALNGRKRHTGGFAADQDEFMPASCCFGSGHHGWRPFTLYILMRSGDVYALNPLVPSRWMASRDYIQILSLDITAELEACTEETTAEHRAMIRHQTKWINDVLNQEANIANALTSSPSPRGQVQTCLKRPVVVGPEPALQGPFLFDPAPQELAIDDCPAGCDIFHLEAGLIGVIGIVYSHGKLDICIEPEVLSASWVNKKSRFEPQERSNLPVIASYETINLGIQAGTNSDYTSWPTFTKDPHQAQLLFVNHITGVTAFSMKTWLRKLETALDDEDDGFITRVLERSPRSQVQKIVDTFSKPVDGCCVIYEAYIGYLLIAGHSGGLSSVEFDEPLPTSSSTAPPEEDTITLQPARRHDPLATPRATRFTLASPLLTPKPVGLGPSLPPAPKLSILQPPYQPSRAFTTPSSLPQFLKQQKSAKSPFLFSAETLDTFKSARALLKSEFDTLMEGAQEMYDRAAAQRLEYNKQLECIYSLHARLGVLKDRNVRKRLERFIERQEEMQTRADRLLRQLIINNEVGLSDAEKKWKKEVDRVSERVMGDGGNTFGQRTLAVSEMDRELRLEAVEEGFDVEGTDGVPANVREGKLNVLRGLIEREDALIASTRRRLDSLVTETERLA